MELYLETAVGVEIPSVVYNMADPAPTGLNGRKRNRSQVLVIYVHFERSAAVFCSTSSEFFSQLATELSEDVKYTHVEASSVEIVETVHPAWVFT